MIVSGGLFTVVGASFVVMAAKDDPMLAGVAGYAAPSIAVAAILLVTAAYATRRALPAPAVI